MDEPFLYQKIAESIRQEILSGKLKPGDPLPPVRQMKDQWECTVGTVQRAYRDLADQGLLVSRVGQGTRVAHVPPIQAELPMRRAALTHRAEAFLLEALTAGYGLEEVEEALRLAMDRWRVLRQAPQTSQEDCLRFAGSHDMALNWLAAHFAEIVPAYCLRLSFSGSLGGLIALAQGQADLAGCHLLDAESHSYNLPFVQRLLPGRRVALVTLAHRRLGLILPAGNPARLQGLEDLRRPGLRFANRQAGSGTRVWLDIALQRAGIPAEQIQGYADEKMTHSEVALAVAEKQADVGLGLETPARTYGLEFIPLTGERYDLVVCQEQWDWHPVRALVAWLQSNAAAAAISALAGYDARETGQVTWVG
ncbi:MAG: substrate-binding domain-containing protein [Chloroflexota bacterium]